MPIAKVAFAQLDVTSEGSAGSSPRPPPSLPGSAPTKRAELSAGLSDRRGGEGSLWHARLRALRFGESLATFRSFLVSV
jgi:hypothetical protein